MPQSDNGGAVTVETDKPHLVTVARMEVFASWTRDSAGEREVVILGDGVSGSIVCFECVGSGDWPYGPTEAECGPCVDCKGTGRILVSI